MRLRRWAPLGSVLAAAFLFRIGNMVAHLALPWFVITRTGSAGLAGVVAASGIVATVAGSLIGGGIVDSAGPRRVALGAGLIGGLAAAMIPLLERVDALPVFALMTLVVLGAVFDAPGMAAQESRLPELGRIAGLSVHGVTAAKGVLSNSAILAGPVLGGVAIGLLGAAPALYLTSFCSTVAGLLAFRVLPRHPKRQAGRATASEGGIWTGIYHLRREPLLGPLLVVVTSFAGIMSAISAVMVPALFLEAGRPATDYGLFASALGAGGLLGAAGHGVLGKRIAPRFALAVGFASYAAAVLSLTLMPSVPALLGIGAGAGLTTGMVSPIFNGAIYARTPVALRGRVLGAISAVATSAAPVSLIVAGLVVDRMGPTWAITAAAPLAMLVAALALRLNFDAPIGERAASSDRKGPRKTESARRACVPPRHGERRSPSTRVTEPASQGSHGSKRAPSRPERTTMKADNNLVASRGAVSDNEPTALNRRTHRRFPVELEVTLKSEHNFFAGLTENLSEGGLFIATHQIDPVGSKFRITFTLEGMFGAVDVLCEVCWLRPYHERLDAPAGMGVRFIEIDDETRSAIRQFIQARDPIFYED